MEKPQTCNPYDWARYNAAPDPDSDAGSHIAHVRSVRVHPSRAPFPSYDCADDDTPTRAEYEQELGGIDNEPTPEQWLLGELRRLADRCRDPYFPHEIADRIDLMVAAYEAAK